MEIFSESPKSFKMDRKSPLASMLKLSISKKLLKFLGNYTDDVLAEYITVLVCNGKNQIQARDDLEAFLGERSGEFVSWLWVHLLKYAHESNPAIGLLDPKDYIVTSPRSSGADRDLSSSRSKDVQNRGKDNADRSLTKNEYCHPAAHTSSYVHSNNVELSEGSQICKGPVAPLNGVNTDKIQFRKQSASRKEISPSENIRLSRIGGSSLVPTGREQSFEYVDKSEKIVNNNGNGLASQLLDFTRREMVSRNLQPSFMEGPHTTQTYAANVSTRNSPRAVGEISCQSKKLRGSVWDRLGKPYEVTDGIFDAHAVGIVEKDQEVYDQNTLSVLISNEELGGSIKNEVQEFDKNRGGNNPGECNTPEQGMSTICKLHAANNIRRKRHFGEISSCPSSCPISETAAPALVSQVQDVKQRLRQIELEMSKVRTKQLEMKKDGKPHVLPNSGVTKQSEEDVKSRTVLVTNVHFAATKEALSFHFSKCGVVLNVVILTDKLSAQPKGSAFITFANKESVDKAVALSGTSFFSRTLKVSRKAEEAVVAPSPPQRAGKPSQAQLSHINRVDRPFYPSSHLQWRREPVSTPEPSTSLPSKKTTKVAASSTDAPFPTKSLGPL